MGGEIRKAEIDRRDEVIDIESRDIDRRPLLGGFDQERARAFDYAFRGTGAVASGLPGKGLGLAVSREILEANGGKISLTSEAGFGSEVTMLLPFQKAGR